MLRRSSMNIALGYAEQLIQNNVVVMPMPNTVLNNLVGYSIPLYYKPDSANPSSISELVELNTTGTLDNPTDHDKESDSIINSLSKIVTQHLSFARNVVKPIFTNLSEQIIEYLDNNKISDPSSSFNIDIIELPDVLNNDTFLNSIAYGKDRKPLVPVSYLSLGNKSIEEINEFMLTGSDTINKQIIAWLSEKNSSFIMNIWNNFFGGISNNVGYNTITGMNPYLKTHYLLALYLIANGLLSKVQENSNISLKEYNEKIQEIIDYSVRALADAINLVNNYNKTKIVVLGIDKPSKTIMVNKETYNDWLSQGNEPEILLGMVVSGEFISSASLIDNKKEAFKNAWNTYCKFYTVNEKQKRIIYFREQVYLLFFESMKNITEPEQEYINANPEYFATVKKLAANELALIKESDMDDVYMLALRLVGKCRFYYTSAYTILESINNASLDNAEVDVREAALISTINYISDYLADQISISK